MNSSEQAKIGVSHVAIVVPNLDAAAARFATLFGVFAGAPAENPVQGVRLRRIAFGSFHIELLEPTRPDGPLAGFLRRNPGGGLHHLALKTRDLDATLTNVADAGVDVIGNPGVNVDGNRMAFLKPATVLGVLVELEEAKEPINTRD